MWYLLTFPSTPLEKKVKKENAGVASAGKAAH